ncbi:hypothetical protein BDB01DRAFT_894836 [Pilobolus umbonatus]|nr:hypothetical protein BDB01DRAFT_894836 [Pilobolus umbonatus]
MHDLILSSDVSKNMFVYTVFKGIYFMAFLILYWSYLIVLWGTWPSISLVSAQWVERVEQTDQETFRKTWDSMRNHLYYSVSMFYTLNTVIKKILYKKDQPFSVAISSYYSNGTILTLIRWGVFSMKCHKFNQPLNEHMVIRNFNFPT